MASITHEYEATDTAKSVAKWQQQIAQAPSDGAAQTQLLYLQLLQLRTIKVILAWALLVIPALATAGFLIVMSILGSS